MYEQTLNESHLWLADFLEWRLFSVSRKYSSFSPLINLPEASTFFNISQTSKNCLSPLPFIYAIKPRHKWCRRATNHFNVKFAFMKWISWQVAFNSECHSTAGGNFSRALQLQFEIPVTSLALPEAWKKLASKCFGSSPKKIFLCVWKKTSF